jgi:caspase domain-containing protein
MNRYAILIHAEEADEQNRLRGPAVDVRNLQAYLGSPLGGAWRKDEIEPASHPTIERVLEMIERANRADFVLFFFSGHGGYYGRRMAIQLRYGDAIMVHDVVSRIRPACAIIIDACRSEIREEVNLVLPGIEGLLNERVEHIDDYRETFDRAVAESRQQKVVLYGCRRDEDAVDTPTGGLFISNLINQATEWSARQRGDQPRVLSCSDALARAKDHIAMTGFDQTPVLDPISGYGGHPPFAVWLPIRR